MRPSDPNKGVWPTPDWLFEPLHRRHRFDLDAAASRSNAKCSRYFTVRTSALSRRWDCRCFWNNPPYGTEPGTGEWVQYARGQVELGHAESGCLLIPVKAETEWYQDYVWGDCRVVASRNVSRGPLPGCWYRLREPQWFVEILVLRGRVSFSEGTDSRHQNGFFASALVFFNAPPGALLFQGGTP